MIHIDTPDTALSTTNGIKPNPILSILKGRTVGKSSMQLAYDISKLILIWDEFSKSNRVNTLGMEKVHYQHFIRLYNRKKRQRFNDINAAGYSCVKLSDGWIKQRDWCTANLKPGAFINSHNYFWFAYDEDAVLFKMHWL